MSSSADVLPAALETAKLQALYHFAYGLSHEINNPLANIATRAQTLLAEEPNPERRRKLATIVQQAFRAHEMIADLMLFARPPALRLVEVDLIPLVDTVVAELQEQANEQGTKLTRRGENGPLVVKIDSAQIAVALKAIVQNAMEAVRQSGEVEIGVAKSDGSGSDVVLTVTDDGPGIPPAVLPHIFDPFFSGREAGRGLGLGLSKAWRIVELHGGKLAVDCERQHGAKFTIELPRGEL